VCVCVCVCLHKTVAVTSVKTQELLRHQTGRTTTHITSIVSGTSPSVDTRSRSVSSHALFICILSLSLAHSNISVSYMCVCVTVSVQALSHAGFRLGGMIETLKGSALGIRRASAPLPQKI